MKISEVRDIIDRLNWNRMDATGGTPDENRRCDLPGRLAPYIAKVESLEIPKRFADDIQRKAHALQSAATVIERWEASQLSTLPGETTTMSPVSINNSISHLVVERRNETANGDCEMLVQGFGWRKFSNRLCAVLINHEWWVY